MTSTPNSLNQDMSIWLTRETHDCVMTMIALSNSSDLHQWHGNAAQAFHEQMRQLAAQAYGLLD